MSLKIFRVVDIKAGVNIFKGSPRRKLCGIDKRIVFRVYPVSCGSQTVVRFKAQVPCFVPAFYLINGKGVFVLWGFLFRLLLYGLFLRRFLLRPDMRPLYLGRLFPGKGRNGFHIISRIVGVTGKLPLPCPLFGRPTEAVSF